MKLLRIAVVKKTQEKKNLYRHEARMTKLSWRCINKIYDDDDDILNRKSCPKDSKVNTLKMFPSRGILALRFLSMIVQCWDSYAVLCSVMHCCALLCGVMQCYAVFYEGTIVVTYARIEFILSAAVISVHFLPAFICKEKRENL